MNIGTVGSKEEFADEVRKKGIATLDAASLTSIWSTLGFLSQSSEGQLSFVPEALSIVPSMQVPEAEAKFLAELTVMAHTTSAAAACSSLLAGRSSESDQYGDVGVLLPLIEGEDKIAKVLQLLGLHGWVEGGGKIVRYDTTTRMPHGVSSAGDVARLFYMLEDPIELRLDGGMSERIWIYIGKLKLGQTPFLAGLVGVGTWSDM